MNKQETKLSAFFKSLLTPAIFLLVQTICSVIATLAYAVATMLLPSNTIDGLTGANIFENAMRDDVLLVSTAVSGILTAVFLVFYYRKRANMKYSEIAVSPIKAFPIVLALVWGAAAMLFTGLGTDLVYELAGYTSETTVVENASLIITFFSVAVIAPITEELVFRGFMFERLRRRFSVGATVVITALVFSLVHFNATGLLSIFVMGLVLGLLRAKYNDLFACIAFHVVANSIALSGLETLGIETKTIIIICSAVVFAVVTAFVVFNKRNTASVTEE